MGMKIDVKKDVLFKAPEHIIIWALNPCYTTKDGTNMILCCEESNAGGFPGIHNWRNWTTKHQQMISCDNGDTWKKIGDVIDTGSYESTGDKEIISQYFLDADTNVLISIYIKSEVSKTKNDSKFLLLKFRYKDR